MGNVNKVSSASQEVLPRDNLLAAMQQCIALKLRVFPLELTGDITQPLKVMPSLHSPDQTPPTKCNANAKSGTGAETESSIIAL